MFVSELAEAVGLRRPAALRPLPTSRCLGQGHRLDDLSTEGEDKRCSTRLHRLCSTLQLRDQCDWHAGQNCYCWQCIHDIIAIGDWKKKARRRHLREGLPMYSNLLRSVSISYDVAGGCSAAIRCEDVGQDNRSESQRGDRVTARAQHIMSHQVVMLTEPTKRMPFNGCD